LKEFTKQHDICLMQFMNICLSCNYNLRYADIESTQCVSLSAREITKETENIRNFQAI